MPDDGIVRRSRGDGPRNAGKTKNPRPVRGTEVRQARPAVPPWLGTGRAVPPLRAHGSGLRRTDTPLPITAEKPAPPTGPVNPARSGRNSRSHSASAQHRAHTVPRLARPRASTRTCSDRRRSCSSIGPHSTSGPRTCQGGPTVPPGRPLGARDGRVPVTGRSATVPRDGPRFRLLLTDKNVRSIVYVRDQGREAARQGPGGREGTETSRALFRGIRVRSRFSPDSTR